MIDAKNPEEDTFGLENLLIAEEKYDEAKRSERKDKIPQKLKDLDVYDDDDDDDNDDSEEEDDVTAKEDSDGEDDVEDEQSDYEKEDDESEEDKEDDDGLIERAPIRGNHGNFNYHPYDYVNGSQKPEPEKHFNIEPTGDIIIRSIIANLDDNQILSIADGPEFLQFIEKEYAKNCTTVPKPRRESQDSSYFSDGSPYSCGHPATPQDKKEMTAREALRATLNEDVKRKDWVQLNLLPDEAFRADETGNSRLHQLVLEDKKPHLAERFYNLVEFMRKYHKEKFSTIIRSQSSPRSIIERKHPDFIDYFTEVEMSMKEENGK